MQGLITDDNHKENILNKFIDKFVKSDYTFKNQATGGIKLIWCNFREEYKVYSTDELFQSPLKIHAPVYFYSERTQELFLTDFEDVRSYINNLEPWAEVDAEIFDESLEWVIAVTHEDVSMASGFNITIDEYDYEKDKKISLEFSINTGNPKNNSSFDNEDTKLSEAIYTIFPLETEDAILTWGDENMALSYRYDLSIMMDDIIQMLFDVLNNNVGERFVEWSSNTFAMNWNIRWFEKSLEIEARFREEFNTTNYLKNHNMLKTEKAKFLSEWGKIINVLLTNLLDCGYNCQSITNMSLLFEANNMLRTLETKG